MLTISVHQNQNYQVGRGRVEDNGEGEGKGYSINVPLPPGSGVGAYIATFNRDFIPALDRYQPGLIMSLPASIPIVSTRLRS